MTAKAGDTLLRRTRLLDRLDRAAQIVVVVGPTGFGKTTLLRDWVAGLDPDGPVVLWVALTGRVRTAADFWRAVVGTARRFGMVADEAATLARLDAGQDPAAVVGDVIAAAGRPAVLVVDAYQHANDAVTEIDEAITRLAAGNPRLQVVVSTRGGSGLASPTGRLRHGVDVIDDADLALTAEETAELLSRDTAHPRTAAAVHAIHRSTSGYPLAVRAVLLGERDHVPEHHTSAWHSVVAETLLGTLDDGLRRFLTDTAVPPYFDVALARQLSPRQDVDAMIAAVERDGLGRWIPFAPGAPVFQYVDAVRDVVRVAAESDRRRFERACGVSAAWLHALGESTAALSLAVAGRHYELASRVVSGILLSNPESYTTSLMDQHLSAVPDEALVRHPVLAFARGLVCLTAVATRPAALDYFRISAAAPTEDLSAPDLLLHHCVKVVSLRLLGRYADSAAAARAVVEHLATPAGQSDAISAEARPAVLRHTAYSLLQGGDVEAASEVVARAAGAAVQPWSRNYTLAYAVGIDAFDGRRDEAEAARRLIDPEAWPPGQEYTYVNALGRIGRATVLLDDFAFKESLAEYDGCEFLVKSEFWPFISWTRLLAQLGMGDAAAEVRRIDEILASGHFVPGIGANLGTAALHNALATAWLAVGRQGRAAALLTPGQACPAQLAPARLLSRILADDAQGAVIELSGLDRLAGHTLRSRSAAATLGAAAALRVGNEPLAVSLLERSATLFRAHGVRAHLATVPAEDLIALRDLAADRRHATVSDYLACDIDGLKYGDVVGLSEREREVLGALTVHGTREGVAAALHVSVNTVKAHLKTAYRKLGVATRDGAIERALELDLLPRQR